ncbi:SpoIIE family protein phosphatase [Micromonospora cathayae]|uniref:histidine kinase n=1 Tax=Micromonospora cathayae TaxID=3028804 RepID=A0ABY7ZMR1_9ACTN|nr:SpoIIE family protein phosphatase [Micromonospora sp. HUAS 3]WDZ84276.1 PAS domain-containing protein [Micromonospora sp. HUAS 3]
MADARAVEPARPDGHRWREVFAAGGAAGARIATHDWATTALGPVTGWPQSLRTAVTICLHSRFPILLWWGPDLVMLHNDAYQPILGESKRDAMGRPGAEVWPEVWDVTGPVLDGVLAGQGATWSQDQLLLLDRNGFLEECYFTFSYSPIIDETGAPGGVFTAVTETTDRVVGDRRLRTLSDLGASLVDAGTPEEIGRRAVKVLAGNRTDVPFVRLYLVTADGPRLAAGGGPTGTGDDAWPLAAVLADGVARVLPVDPAADPDRPGTALAVVTPVVEPGGGPPTAVLVTGLNPRRPLDDDYRSFVDLLAGHLGAASAGARACQAERLRAEALAELDAARSTFSADVSHELRTPLPPITGPVPAAGDRERARRAEAAARADQQHADRRFRTLVEASSAVVWSADADGAIGEPQPTWAAYTGQRWPEYAGTGWAAMVHPADAPRLLAAWRQVRAAGAPLFEFEGRLWHADSGTYRHVAVRAASQRDGRGAITEWIGTIYDTDDRVRAEERARRTAAISDALLDTSPVGFGWVDADLRYRYLNPALAVMHQVPAEAHLGRRPGEVTPGYGRRVEELLRRTLTHGPVSGVEFRLPDPDPAARPRHVVANYFPIRIAQPGELVGVGFTLVDVTERTRLAQALGEQQARYERLAATDVLAVFGGEGDRITEANEAFLTMLGHTAGDVVEGRLTWPGLTPPGWEEPDRQALDELAATGRAQAYRKEYLHRDGHPVPVQIGVVALRRRPLRWLAYATDLSAERAAQTELRLFQALVERSGDFIAVAAPDGRVVYVNPAGREFVGLAGDAPLDRLRLLDFAAPEVRRVWRRDLIPAALRAGHHRAESLLVRLDTGERRDVDHQTFTVTTGDGPESTAFLATVARDVGDRRRALRQAEGLARLAGALSTAAGRSDVVTAVVAIAPDVLDGARVRITTAAPGDTVLTVTDRGAGDRLDIDDDVPLARAVRDNEVVTFGAADRAGTVGGLCLPLRYGDGGPLGAVEARWARPVTDDDALRNLLDTVAGLCSQALQRAELTRSARAMAEFAARLSVTRSTAEAIEVILTAAPVALGATAPGLAIYEEGQPIRLHHAGLSADLAGHYDDLTLDDPRPMAVALRTGERIILPDRAAFAARFPGLVDRVGAEGLVTTAVLPLLDAQRRPFAALGFGWPRVRPLREGDLALLDTIADLCEQTLERVRLAAAEHNLVTRLAGRLRTSSRPAPASLDIAMRYRPAMTGLNLGGDWYDLIRLDGDRLAVVVGDVVGHQVEAAADMAQLRTMVNTLIRTGVPLGEVFPRLTDLVGVGFLGTCLALVVDPAAGRASMVRAGHPHPLLARRRRRPVTVETAPSLPLGMVRDTMPVTEVPFETGDLLVAYTDGVVERRDLPYDAGVAALRTVVSAHRRRPVERIADAILTALPGSDDDQALVVIRHVGQPSTDDGRPATDGDRTRTSG